MPGTAPHAAEPANRTAKLTDQPWWTEADQAELDALWWAWVEGAWEHRDRCKACLSHEAEYGSQWCDALTESLQVVLDFQRARRLVSKARWLRAGEALREFELLLGREREGVLV